MPLPSETLATYQAVGNREDLTDLIERISPTDTPFMSGTAKGKADAVNHEWQTEALAAVDSGNAVLEGDDATTDAATLTSRLGNICQISDKVARVSGTQEAVKHAGRGSEMAHQEMLKGLELKRDMESILIGVNQTKVTGDTTTARKLSSVLSWIATNDDHVGTSPTTSGSVTRVDGTQRAFTEAQLKNVLQLCWNEGGKPGTIMTGGFNKQIFSTFVGRASQTEDTKSKKITASVDAYESDFGTLKVVPNRFQRSRDVFVLEMDKWEVVFLNGRRNVSIPLAKTGDSERRQVLSEYTLVSKNEKASGGVFDLTVS
jgi:hypothetical protein